MRTPAVLGGSPAFPDGLQFARPTSPPLNRVMARLAPSHDRGILTNGPLVRELEERIARRLGCRHVVAVSSCTAGLMLAFRALGASGPVVLPSFTFAASAHAVAWNGLEPRFVECDRLTFQLDLVDAARHLGGAAALLAVHVFGAPCAPAKTEALALEAGVPLVFDGAAAMGARTGDRPVGGFGDVEVFSLSPTKPLIAGEGGLVATNRDDIDHMVRIGRDYANPGDYDTRFVGLNARMSEFHAAVALESLETLDDQLAVRALLASRYRDGLASVPGLHLQQIEPGDVPTWKDLTVSVDPEGFGITRDQLVEALGADGIDTRSYFDPPVHRHRAYTSCATDRLPATDATASSVVSLPIYPGLSPRDVDKVVAAVRAAPAMAGRRPI